MHRAFGFVRRLAADETGVALVFVIAVFLFLFVLILSVYSVGENIRRKEELQNACDAAAYSAAVIQADGLSRMAVINRAMAWTHIQTTKMQMDYITYKWLKHVRDCFREDMDNIKETGMDEFAKPEMGYHHFSKDYPDPYYSGRWLDIHFTCYDHVHDNANDARARYIGLGPNTEGGANVLGQIAGGLTGGAVGAVRDHHWIRINGFAATDRRLQYANGDLDYYEGGSCKASKLVATLEEKIGRPDGAELEKQIRIYKTIITDCGAMLKDVNDDMAEAIPVAAKAALYANLPRRPNGSVDSSLLQDYVFAISPGALPSSECDPYDNSRSTPGYYDPLHNREEDEIRFLAMANGLATANGLPTNDNDIKLKDFFASSGPGGSLAAGLDQWFIRCDPNEAGKSDKVGVFRNFVPASKGIVRAYKNANYAEGRTGDGTLRGNYCIDGNGPRQPHKPSDLPSALMWGYLHCPKPPPIPPYGNIPYFFMWCAEWPRLAAADNYRNLAWGYWSQAPYDMFAQFSKNPDPSCINYRERFVDQCANVKDSWGLVAEYEWAAAYWSCCWFEFKHWKGTQLDNIHVAHQPHCIHIPIPAAVFGGRNHSHYGHSDTPSEIAREETPGKSTAKDKELGNLSLRGWSRNDYCRTFIGADGEEPYECIFHGGDGRGANMGAKGYVRIYGDDKDLFNECYVGAKAKPWVLNERFFNGMGTIIVGVARRQRNVFYWIKDDDGSDASDKGIYQAFTPKKAGRGEPRIVALAAARAAYAPRKGNGLGDGSDSVNADNREGGLWGRRYELRYDAVTGVDGHGNLAKPSLAYNGAARQTLENDRIGCVCGKTETGKRLRRQWNLSQTDWDAVLLPLRFAFSDPSRVNGRAYDSHVHGRDATTHWSFSDDGGSTDPQHQLARKVLPKLTWGPLSVTGGGTPPTETWEKVFLEPNEMDDTGTYRLFKQRLIH